MPTRVWFVSSGDGVVLLLLLLWDGRSTVGEVSGRGRVRHVASSGSSANRKSTCGIITVDLCVLVDRKERSKSAWQVGVHMYLGACADLTASAKLAMSPEPPPEAIKSHDDIHITHNVIDGDAIFR